MLEPEKFSAIQMALVFTGAQDATTIEMKKAFIIGVKEIPAGKYAFFTIPWKNTWIVIINKNWQQHLATEYHEKEDVVRIKVKAAKNVHTERLQYFIKTTKSNNRKIALAWEKVKIEFSFIVQN